LQKYFTRPAAGVGNLQEIENAGDANDAAHDVVAKRFDEIEDELRFARLEAFDELVQVVPNRQDRRLVTAFRETGRDLPHDDVGLFFVGL
jgi:hypothetical protein